MNLLQEKKCANIGALVVLLCLSQIHAFSPYMRILIHPTQISRFRNSCRLDAIINNDSNKLDVIDAKLLAGDNENNDYTGNPSSSDDSNEGNRIRKRDMFRDMVKTLASLSLKDYKWRSDLFKKNEAERSEEEILAIMRGDQASYVRPMDAGEGRKGPLGDAEENAVRWLREVFEAEAKRAQKMADGDGDVVRPIDSSEGPLAELELRAINFLRNITDSETERVVLRKVRIHIDFK